MRTYFITFGYGEEAAILEETGNLLEIIATLKKNGWKTEEISAIHTTLYIEGHEFNVRISDACGYGYYATAEDHYDGTPGRWIAHDFKTPENAIDSLGEQIEELIFEGKYEPDDLGKEREELPN